MTMLQFVIGGFAIGLGTLLGVTVWTWREHRAEFALLTALLREDSVKLRTWMRRDPWHGANVEHNLPNWMRLSLYPDFIIGGKRRPYLKRWYLLPRSPWRLLSAGVYLHQILRSDDERALHDHPWPNISMLLYGSYDEVIPARTAHFKPWMTPYAQKLLVERRPGDIIFRRATSPHRLIITPGHPVWSLFIVGPRIRQWGFWCRQGWRHWKNFVSPTNGGAVGRGCG